MTGSLSLEPVLQAVESFWSGLPQPGTVWIGFSGGLDSTVLLHALTVECKRPVRAVHVHHGLHPHADQWLEQCRQQCQQWGVPFESRAVDGQAGAGQSPEAAAREARYGAFAAILGPNDYLLTAHHRDDQSETLLLQLFRGSGPHGLAAMPSMRPLGEGTLGRPLLSVSREQLYAYAESRALSWVDDPSNQDHRFDRNYIRNALLPTLQAWKPGVVATLTRTARVMGEASLLLDEVAEQDLKGAETDGHQLTITGLARLSLARQRNLLRFWIRSHGLPIPAERHIDAIVQTVVAAAADRTPVVDWPGAEVRRHDNKLYAMRPLPQAAPYQAIWRGESALSLADGAVMLKASTVAGDGVSSERLADKTVNIRPRTDGEQCYPAGRGGHCSLKQLFQERRVPPWLRGHWPLLYVDDELVAVPGLMVSEGWQASDSSEGIRFSVTICH